MSFVSQTTGYWFLLIFAIAITLITYFFFKMARMAYKRRIFAGQQKSGLGFGRIQYCFIMDLGARSFCIRSNRLPNGFGRHILVHFAEYFGFAYFCSLCAKNTSITSRRLYFSSIHKASARQ